MKTFKGPQSLAIKCTLEESRVPGVPSQEPSDVRCRRQTHRSIKWDDRVEENNGGTGFRPTFFYHVSLGRPQLVQASVSLCAIVRDCAMRLL